MYIYVLAFGCNQIIAQQRVADMKMNVDLTIHRGRSETMQQECIIGMN